MAARIERQVVCDVSRRVLPTKVGRCADKGVGESGNRYRGRAEIRRVGNTGVEAQSRHVEPMIQVIELLLEIVHAHQCLVD